MKKIILTPLLILCFSLQAMDHPGLLICAAINEDLEEIRRLLERGTDINHVITWENTALHCVAIKGNLAIAKLLIEKGADPKRKNINGETALHCAAVSGHPDLVQLFLEKGADITQLSTSDNTALHLAARRGHHAVIKLLLEHGASATTRNNEDKTALQEAGIWGVKECCELLVNHLMRVPSDTQRERRMAAWLCLKRLGLSKDILRLMDGLIMRDIEAENRENPEGSIAEQQINTIICFNGATAAACLKTALLTKFWPNYQIEGPQ
eukprot:Pompholyxophrys_sp_v1_NODE_27_length_3750_cov_2.904465.p3 type:complete len:267 gc:universal NODE_27_length_3750_cov_2.904465:164-964(+)